jgi:hypothetical protein
MPAEPPSDPMAITRCAAACSADSGGGAVSDDVDIVEWSLARGKPIPGVEPERIGLLLFSPVPPPGGIPEWLYAELREGDIVNIRREPRPDSNQPDFTLWTASQRPLGRVPDRLRGFIECFFEEELSLEFAVYWSVPAYLAEQRLMIELSLLVWPAPGETVPRKTPYPVYRNRAPARDE